MRESSLLSSISFPRLLVALSALSLTGATVACSDEVKPSPHLPELEQVALPTPPLASEIVPVAFAEEEVEVIVARASSREGAPNLGNESSDSLDLLAEEALYHDAGEVRNDQAHAAELIADGRSGEAVTALRHALFDDASADNWAKLGDAYLRSGEPTRARRALEQAVALNARHVAARQQLVRLHLEVGELKEAKAAADLLVRSAPDDVRARYLAGIAYMKNAMWKQAIEQMEDVTAAEPQNIYAHNNAGFAAIQIGDVQKALVHLEPIAQLADAHGYMLNNLGVAYERAGRAAEAHAAFSRAVELRPGYVNGIINKKRIEQGMDDAAHVLSAEVLIGLRTPAGAGARERVAQEETSHDEKEAEANGQPE